MYTQRWFIAAACWQQDGRLQWGEQGGARGRAAAGGQTPAERSHGAQYLVPQPPQNLALSSARLVPQFPQNLFPPAADAAAAGGGDAAAGFQLGAAELLDWAGGLA